MIAISTLSRVRRSCCCASAADRSVSFIGQHPAVRWKRLLDRTWFAHHVLSGNDDLALGVPFSEVGNGFTAPQCVSWDVGPTPHPGEILRELCLRPLRVTVTQAATALGVSRKTLSAILNGRAGISPEMAIRLSLAFNTTAESWLNQQVQYDLWHADRNRKHLHVRRIVAA